jgi:hypothetical protein
MMDATTVSETIPNLDTKFLILPSKFFSDGPSPDKARLFYCMGFSFDGNYQRDISLDYYAAQMTK